MNFLQPALLWGLLLASVPIIIHLIHQRRFRTMEWGAMYFLRKAKQQAKGMARLKQWLILAMRTLAVLALALVVSRPLSGGWIGQAGAGNLPLAIILLDRSPSMELQVSDLAGTKRETGLQMIVDACENFKPGRVVLIDNVNMTPIEVVKPSDLLDLPEVGASDQSTHWPSMLQKALEYIAVNKPGNCQVWMCSDMKQNDWDLNSGLWASIKDEFPNLNDNIQLLLVPLTQSQPNNTGVRVLNAQRVLAGNAAKVEFSLKVWQQGEIQPDSVNELSLDINVNGTVSRSKIEVTGRESIIDGLAVDIDPAQTNGWGWVRIPQDASQSDNISYFSYSPVQLSRTLLINPQADANGPLVWISESSPDGNMNNAVQVANSERFTEVDISDTNLILWDDILPEDQSTITRLEAYVESGGQLVFMPQADESDLRFNGTGFGELVSTTRDKAFQIESWKTDEGLLAHALDNSSLPVGELNIFQYRKILSGQSAPLILSRFENGDPFLIKSAHQNGFSYFLSTRLDPAWSDLSSNGIVAYVMVQRAIAIGVSSRQGQNLRIAGELPLNQAAKWVRLAGNDEAPTKENAAIAGVYQTGNNQFVAINRSPGEDGSPNVPTDAVKEGFGELPLQIIGDGNRDSESGIVQEIWRIFLIIMVLALLLEAYFSLPAKRVILETESGGGN